MRALHAFMAVWVLVLSLLPCFDEADHTHGHGCHATETQTIKPLAHTEHGENSELCSPFCHCSCCHTSVTFFHLETFTKAAAPEAAAFATLCDQMESQHLVAIWQPPQA